MFNSRLRIISFSILTVLFSITAVKSQPLSFLADSVTYLWPTDSSTLLSSTFAETRSAHLHAGLDIRTWGREGYQVFATRDAIVHRIGMSPYGYGNVIFLKHDDDSYSVYAHLNRFEPGLQSVADSIRFIDYRAAIDEVIEHKNIRYRQGDLIAFTGSTGVGPPHLHFELRTPEFKPFNPLLTNLRVHDTIPPVFRQLAVEYLDPETFKMQNYHIVNVNSAGNRYNFGDITVHGPVGLAVNVHDRANDTPNIYAVHTLTMVHQADTLFHSRADYFPHTAARHMFLDRSYPILAETRRGFQRLYKVSGNQLPFYHSLKNHGLIQFENGSYPIQIIATDINGNRSVADVTIHVSGNPGSLIRDITHIPVYPDPPVNEMASLFNWKYLAIDHDEPVLLSSISENIPYQKNEAPYRYLPGSFIEKKISPGRKSTLSTPDKKAWITLPDNALLDTLHLRMNIIHSQNEIFVNFEPDRLPIHRNIEFSLILPDYLRDNPRLALFSVDQFRNRRFFMSSTNTDGMIRGSLREISSLVISEDNTPPRLGSPRLSRNLAGNHIVIIPARDPETGIDFARSEITVNGLRGLVEYDPEKNWLIYYNPKFRPASSNRVEIVVYDGAGNRSASSATI
jgi:hypothetical protein